MLIHKLLGISELQPTAKKFLTKATFLLVISDFLLYIAQTFLILYALEIVSFSDLGIIISVQLVIMILSDYPSGALGDWIGQKWVIVLAHVFAALGYFLMSIAHNFLLLLLSFSMIGLFMSQYSGAFRAWLDNNYKVFAPEDHNKQIYSGFIGKYFMFGTLSAALAIIVGGIIADSTSRTFVFLTQSVLLAVFSLFLIKVVNESSTQNSTYENKKAAIKEYLILLKEGVAFCFQKKVLLYFFLGITIIAAAMAIWSNFILFPFYEAYSGHSDSRIALLRSTIFLTGALMTGLMGSVAKRLSRPLAVLGWLEIIINPLFFIMMLFLLVVIPPPPEFQLFPYMAVIITFFLFSIPGSLSNVLEQRFYIEVIPDRNRTSIYSLDPTLYRISATIATFFGGFILEKLGIIPTLGVLLIITAIGALIAGTAILSYEKKERQNQKLSDAN